MKKHFDLYSAATARQLCSEEAEIRGKAISFIQNCAPRNESTKPPVSPFQRLRRRMDDSWDFNGAQTKSYTHGMHPYPAMFIPQVANRLLKNYSREGDTVCDIFCGSGTALVESRLLSRNAYGIDLNPFAIFLARVKTSEIHPKLLQREYFKLTGRMGQNFNGAVKRPSFFNVDFWFKPLVIKKLAQLKYQIAQIKDEKIRSFFLVAFAETVRYSSNTKNSEFKLVRIPKEQLADYNPDVLGFFRRKTERNIQCMTEYYQSVSGKNWVKVIHGNSAEQSGIERESIDCIITSPPYGDSRTTVAYGQFSRLASQWLDLINDEDRQIDPLLLGGKKAVYRPNVLPSLYLDACLRRIAEQDEARAGEVAGFYVDLEKCLKNARNILKRGKYFCLVAGNRTVKQVQLPTDFIIVELGERLGFSLVDLFVRNIPNKRMPSKNSPTNEPGKLEETMCKESIVILQKR